MAKITVVGDAVVITSALKFDDLEKVAKFRPEALVLKGGEDGKQDVFMIGTSDYAGDVDELGIIFNRKTRDEVGLAQLTCVFGGFEGDVKEFVADKLGGPLMKLNKLEEQLPAVIAEIAAEHEAVLAGIELA